MSKAFTKEGDGDEPHDDADDADALPRGTKNYMTPAGFAAMQAELRELLYKERPKIVEIVSWAAGNGDRSENGDYIYGKKRLREIDKRVRYLTKRIESAEVVDPEGQQHLEHVFFGATVTYMREDEREVRVKIVGVDEAKAEIGHISWLSPVARALMKSTIGDMVELRTPVGIESIEVLKIHYEIIKE
ncbi:MAG: transcription elongation factor GreB [Alphaproteobacteria bacterium]|nr:transcription elongation factor GreB [Alphaproteobacteria bacterium]